MDHLIAAPQAAATTFAIEWLACKECNGNEKREGKWQTFLKLKCCDNQTLRNRTANIRTWQSQFPKLKPIVLNSDAEYAKAALEGAIKNFEKKFSPIPNAAA
jgi:hypothetical protein